MMFRKDSRTMQWSEMMQSQKEISFLIRVLRTLAFICLVVLIHTNQAHAKWDGKSPMWMVGACSKLSFDLFDKMGKLDKYEIKYVVKNADTGTTYVALRSSGKESPGDASIAVFPNDFRFENMPDDEPGSAAYSYCNGNLQWFVYINGELIAAGEESNTYQKGSVNGKLVDFKTKKQR